MKRLRPQAGGTSGLGEQVRALAERHRLPPAASERIERLLAALRSEPDPPTTISDPGPALAAHVADALVAVELSEVRAARRIADLGSGAGFPGLVLALAMADVSVDLLEAARRKCAVIERLLAAAGLENVRALPVRAEDWAMGEGHAAYDVVTARALASLPVVVEYAAPLLRPGGALVAWRGARAADEEQAGDAAANEVGLSAGEAHPVDPFPGARNRHLHVFVKRHPTPARFPRRAGMATKRPLA